MQLFRAAVLSFLILTLNSARVYSQTNVLVSGGQAAGTGGSSSYSVGQLNFNFATGSNGTVSEGLQQPVEIFATSDPESPSAVSVMVYPNPTFDRIVVSVENYQDHLRFKLTDMHGRLVSAGQITDHETYIPVMQLAPMTYYLNISNAEKSTTLKIIKHH